MRKISIIVLLLFFSTFWVHAQDVQFSASAPKVVSTGEQFRLTFSLNKKPNQFMQPDLSAFQVLIGPSTSFSQSTSIVNGKLTQTISYTYTYILQATKEGEFLIPSAKARIGKKMFESNSVNIEVVKKTANVSPDNDYQTGSTGQTGLGNQDLFVRVLVNKREVYQGDHIIATIKIYSKVNLSGFENVKFPSFQGFLKEDIEIPQLRALERENVNGEIFGSGVIAQMILFPQKNGNLVIEPVEIQCLVQQRVSEAPRSFFDDFFDSYQTRRKQIQSPAMNIKVKPLPEGAPAGFSGAVGNFKLSASLDKAEVKANEAVTLKVRITGNGNLKLIDAPKVDFPLDFETYDPKSDSNLKHSSSGTSGSRSFEYLMIPRFAGIFRIPPITFFYFDPSDKQYKTIQSGDFQITVAKGDQDEISTLITSPSKEDVRFIGKDIRFINSGPVKLKRSDHTIWGSTWFFAAYIIAGLVFLFILLMRTKRLKEQANVELLKNRKASKYARKRLRYASGQMKAGNKGTFYKAVLKALWGYLSDKLGISVSNLSRENVFATMKKHNIDDEQAKAFFNLLDQCEYAQYAPSGTPSDMEDIYRQAVKMITKMEQKIK